MNKRWRFAIIASLIVSAISPWPNLARADDLGQWFKSLRQPGTGASCCDLSDCHPTEFEIAGDHYRAVVNGVMVDIPNDKVLHNVGNPLGQAVICSIGNTIYCFVPGGGV